MSEIRAVIFDCYSTLIDIRTDEKKQELFEQLSLYLQYYGANIQAGGLKAAIAEGKERYLQTAHERYPEVDLEAVFQSILKKEGLDSAFLAESCCKLYRLLSMERFQLFPESIAVLREMKREGYSLAVVSDAQKVFCLEEGRMLGISQFFDHIVMSTQFGFKKPDSRLFAIACSLLNIAPAQAVYVGDDPDKDVKGAKTIGMRVVLLDRNHRDRNQAQGTEPDSYADDLWEAWKWIRRGR